MGVGPILNKIDGEGLAENLTFEQWFDPSGNLENSCPDRGRQGGQQVLE